jgi:hypothetical protein
MLRRVALVRADFSEESIASIIGVTRTGELGTLAVTSNRSTLHLWTLRRGDSKWRPLLLRMSDGITFLTECLSVYYPLPITHPPNFGRVEIASLSKFTWHEVPKLFQFIYVQGIFISPLQYLLQFSGCWKYTWLHHISGSDRQWSLVATSDDIHTTTSFPTKI